jgi:hypothetical protein
MTAIAILEFGIYKLSTGDLVSNAFINLWCVGSGIAIIMVVG